MTRRLTYDAVQIVAASDSAIAERYVWGDGPDELLVEYAGSGTANRRSAHADERGSVIALSDAAGNAVINKYDEFGIPQTGNTGRFQNLQEARFSTYTQHWLRLFLWQPLLGSRSECFLCRRLCSLPSSHFRITDDPFFRGLAVALLLSALFGLTITAFVRGK